MNIDNEQFVWEEKYRPQSLDDLIFPEKYKKKFREWIDSGEIPHIGIFGTIPGTGKSSLINVLIEQLNTDTDFMNGSKENGIDAMRGRISQFASKQAISGKIKLMCIDEADYLTVNAQATLRSDVEYYAKNCRFVFTGNYTDRIIEPLMKRMRVYDLDKIYQENKKELGLQIFNRLTAVLDNEGVEYEKKELMEVVKNFYPATRDMLGFCQQNTVDGVLQFDELRKPDDVFQNLITAMKGRKFKDIRAGVDEVMIPETFYSYMFKHLDDIFEVQSQPDVIIWLDEFQYHSAKASNKTIPLAALLTRIIGDPDVKFK